MSRLLLQLALGLALSATADVAVRAESITQLEAAWEQPPADALPWTFWYWMRGAVSPEGITADLEAMHAAGLGGAYLMPIYGPSEPPEIDPPATQLSARYWEMVRHAAREADRLGLQLGMHVCDGFATAGGPWITPELSMQKLVWSETRVAGDASIDTQLAQPETLEGFYRDVATVALPCPAGYGVTTATVRPTVTTSTGEANATRLADSTNTQRFRSDRPCWIEYAFDMPFTARSVTVTPDGSNYQCQRLRVETSKDGVTWELVAQLNAPRHGWQDEGRPVTHALPETTARRFRFVWDPDGSEPGAEDVDAAKWAAVLKVQSIELSSRATLHHYQGKNGEVWRQSPTTTAGQVPRRLCVPVDQVIEVTRFVDKEGRLRWKAPPGDWLVMRFGHTSTGRQNATAGGGKGLECDKLSASAARLQFDRWFGEAQRQIIDEIGAEGARRVLTTLHVDSWECGAQNWTGDFLEELSQADAAKWLPTMAGVPVASAEQSEAFLKRVRQTIARLMAERFFGTLRSCADDHGLRFTAECTAPTFPADGMQHFAAVDVSMGEFWLKSPTHDKPTDLLDAISAAHAHGKRVVQAEAFTQLRIGWDETPASLKRLGDRNLALGANRLVMHVWTHNPWLDRKPGQTLDGIGLYFQRDQPWMRGARGWMGCLARCHAVLQAGTPVVDIAVEVDDNPPTRAVTHERMADRLPGLVGEKAIARERERRENVGQPQRELPRGVRASANLPEPAEQLDPLRGYAYDSLDAAALVGATFAGRGVTLASGRHYDLLHRSSDAPWSDPDLASLGVTPDLLAFDSKGDRAEGVAWTHCRGNDWDAYLISNQQDTHRELSLSLRARRGGVEVWDPVTSQRRSVTTTRGERTELSLSLAASQSAFVVLRDVPSAAPAGEAMPTLMLSDRWALRFEPLVGPTPDPRDRQPLGDLAKDESLAAFVGTVHYSVEYEWERRTQGAVWLDVGPVSGVAEVRVNGVDCGVAWTAPWRVDISSALRPGSNRVEIAVSGTWKNRLLAEASLPAKKRTAWTSAAVQLQDESPTPLGLLGPVRLLIEAPKP